MTNLDDKLKEPVTIHFRENSIPGLRRGVLTEDSIVQIKQAFEDEGYRRLDSDSQVHLTESTKLLKQLGSSNAAYNSTRNAIDD